VNQLSFIIFASRILFKRYSMRLLLNRKNIRYKLLSLLFVAFILSSCGTGRKATRGKNEATSIRNAVINYSMQYLHKPYQAGGKGPYAFDCSGFTAYVFKKFGYKLGASSEEQDRQAATIQRREDLQVGDLVFFEGQNRNGKVGHVGIVTNITSKREFNFIHASTNNGVIISSSSEPYYDSRYLRGGRILKETAKQRASISTQAPKNSQTKRLTGKVIETDSATIIIHSRPQSPTEATAPQSHNKKEAKFQKKSLAVLTRQTAVPPPEEES